MTRSGWPPSGAPRSRSPPASGRSSRWPSAPRVAGAAQPSRRAGAPLRAHLAEFLGVFALVFFGCGAVAVGALDAGGVALAFGLVIAVMIYAVGHLSGAHFNPAVSIGFAIGRHFPWSRVATYTLAQAAGAIAGAGLLRLTLGDVALGVTVLSVPPLAGLAWEAVMTALLMLVITAVATDTRAVGQAAALAIGGAVALGALVGGPVTGASLNPVRSLGPALIAGNWTDLWVYVVGPIAGASAGAVLYGLLRGPGDGDGRPRA